MDGQPPSPRPGPHFRSIISTTLERVRLQAFGSRARRRGSSSGDMEQDASPFALPTSFSRHQTLTCPHLAHSWFSQPPQSDRERATTRDEEENARATLGELLSESVIYCKTSAFYPPPPTLSEAEQSLVRKQLLSAFEASMQQRTKSSGSSSFRRTPPVRAAPSHFFTRFSSLPTEIRLQIWENALPRRGHRTLHIGQTVTEPYCWTAKLPPPTLARVCRESREVALRRSGVFPIYGHAPYRSGPGASREVTTRFMASWASSDDCIDFGGHPRPPALRCGDYLGRVSDFSAAAHSLSSILLSPGPEAEVAGGGNDQGGASSGPGGVKKLMVVVQTVYISLPAFPPGDLADQAMQENRDQLPVSRYDKITVCTVDNLTAGAPLDPLRYGAAVLRRPKSHHITTVASLHDRQRIEELLALGTVTRHWTNGESRLRSLHYHSNAFCMDCLLEWWNRHALGAATEALLGEGPGPSSLAGVTLGRETASGGRFDVLPELVPSVRFKIQWPGLEDNRS